MKLSSPGMGNMVRRGEVPVDKTYDQESAVNTCPVGWGVFRPSAAWEHTLR